MLTLAHDSWVYLQFLYYIVGLTESEAANLQEKLDWLNAIMQDELSIIQNQVPRHSELKSLVNGRDRGMICIQNDLFLMDCIWLIDKLYLINSQRIRNPTVEQSIPRVGYCNFFGFRFSKEIPKLVSSCSPMCPIFSTVFGTCREQITFHITTRDYEAIAARGIDGKCCCYYKIYKLQAQP